MKEEQMVRSCIEPLVTVLLVFFLAGCSRGIFLGGPCSSAQRIPLDAKAATAVYLDKDGQPIGTRAELLKDTRTNTPKDIAVNNVMCPQ
jgi:hypothetical protein